MKKTKSNIIKNKIKSRSATLIKTKKNQKKITKKSEPKQKKRLGMGLSSLLSKDEELASVIKSKVKIAQFPKNGADTKSLQNVTNFEQKISKINEKTSLKTAQKSLPIQFLVSGKFQPRKSFDQQELEELAESIKMNGVLQPILVRPLNNSGTSYEIIAGERRWRASQIAKLHEVPVIIRSFNDETALGVAMIENLQRSDLNLVEEAQGYRSLMNNFQYTQEKLSLHIGKSRSHIANVLRILSLPKNVKRHIMQGEISFGHARSLVTLTEDQASQIADEIIDGDLSVRQTEKIVSSLKSAEKSFTSKGFVNDARDEGDPNIENLERDLTNLLGLKISITNKANNSGNMTIYYKNLDQLQPIIDKLKWRPK